ncbi:outer membrane lipid asymmetry maintenance protein MlaD [Flavimaricola marinus]|uniref:Putative phospholipid ABC transporter-binding protein MlaD n=1 Tax=Flavimaricola marinus TaxID=1819565 RepID=A0A238LIT4_9RHOB|nr:outer membrane lipid asymmetry maintenance protein MlaD [Flavimaricola marinus]SMY09561.1 putative phospholipid ABC transporter-binding protein MlaD [Flavimaricola marinus]
MRESLTEVIVGAAVVVAAAGFLGYTAQATGYVQSSGDMVLTASFRSIEGVSVGTDVRLAGVKIGSVTGMDLNPETYRADTVLTLVSDIPIPDDSSAVVASEGLLGGNYIELVPGGSFDNFESGAEIVDTQGAVSLLQLLLTYVGGGTSTE